MATRPSLEDLLKDVPLEKLNQPCRDEHLSKIALSITDWQSVAPFLRLTKADEEEIKRDYANTKTQKIAMLRKWKERLGRKAKYRKLTAVFWDLEQTDLVEKISELLQAECSSSSSDEDGHPATKRSRRSTLDSYADYLRGRYSAETPAFFTLQWPPPPTRKVFNLAIIGHETIQRGPVDEELVRLTLRGNVDDITRRKSSIELKSLFQLNSRKRKVILVEGAPGAGKSTLAWHICQKWESGELFQEFKVVVFVQLRDPVIQSAKTLADLLPARSSNMRTELQSVLESCDGHGVLFVLDGWDEYGAGLHGDSLFKQLICTPGEVNMHLSSLIITSRPIASGELQQYASSRVEIVGFTKAEVKKYFSESIGDIEKERKLHDHLRERPVIEASCYLPLNAAIIVHLFLALSHTLPHTLHEVFLKLVLCCIIRHLTKQGGNIPHISSLDDLPPDLQKPFDNICTMAYHGVMKNKATFSLTDLQSFNIPTELTTLSLLQGVQSFAACEKSVSCNFLHLSVQELLAAFHISKLPAAEQIQIFNDLFDQPRLAAVFQFYAAFTKLQTEGVRDIMVRIIQKEQLLVQKEQMPLLVNLLHCLYEAQDPSLCEFVASHLKGKLNLAGLDTLSPDLTLCEFAASRLKGELNLAGLNLSGNTLSPMDCLVVGYFLSCVCLTTSRSREFTVNLSRCSLDEYRVSFLVRELSKCSSSLKPLLTLHLSGNNLSDGGVAHISDLLGHNICLKTLDMPFCRIGDQGMKSVANALETNNSLELLDLGGNGAVTAIGLMALGESLKRNRTLKTLRLNSFGLYSVYPISDHHWRQFIVCLQENNDLTELMLPSFSTRDIVRQEISSLNHIRRKNDLPLLATSLF